MPQQTAAVTPDTNQVATQVQLILTQIPTVTPMILPTSIPPTATVPPKVIPTATATPTAAVSPTATSLPATATPSSTDPRQTLGDPTWTDDLSNGNNFLLYSDDHARITSQNGFLSLTAIKADGWHSWTLSYPKVQNFYLETTATPGTCSGKDRYGLVFRAPADSKGYIYGLSCDGQYNLRIWDGSKFTTVTEWTESSDIHAGSNQTNRLGVMVKSNQFTFYANGVEIGKATDSTYSDAGKIGMFISSSETANFNVQFDEISYWTLP